MLSSKTLKLFGFLMLYIKITVTSPFRSGHRYNIALKKGTIDFLLRPQACFTYTVHEKHTATSKK